MKKKDQHYPLLFLLLFSLCFNKNEEKGPAYPLLFPLFCFYKNEEKNLVIHLFFGPSRFFFFLIFEQRTRDGNTRALTS